MTPVRSTARALLSAVFIVGGWNQIRKPEAHVEIARPAFERIGPTLESIHPKAPSDPRTLVLVNGATQLVGGVLLATGQATRLAAAALAGTLVPTTLAGHRFWEPQDPQQRVQQQIHFLKNLGLLGGLLLAAADTGGKPGLAWRTGHLAQHARRSATRMADEAGRTLRHAAKSGPIRAVREG